MSADLDLDAMLQLLLSGHNPTRVDAIALLDRVKTAQQEAKQLNKLVGRYESAMLANADRANSAEARLAKVQALLPRPEDVEHRCDSGDNLLIPVGILREALSANPPAAPADVDPLERIAKAGLDIYRRTRGG
ncbi:hypothetical protein, partial [Rhodococcus sp. UNC363MFTsu5.1]|uniref:hypothetical protein n=1 Tax=Rhodococcus sp. UNC363MFTsu5.1 TaxID=1449069 RepID=UPI00055F22FF